MTCGIYLLGFNDTPKVYIGMSRNIESRFTEHCRCMRILAHTNKMNDAYTLYGLPTLEILEECEVNILSSREQYHISLWNAIDDGFNYIAKSGNGGGGAPIGENNSNSKHTDSEIVEMAIYILNNKDKSLKSTSIDLGISYSIIVDTCNGRSHVSLLTDALGQDRYNKLLSIDRSNIGDKNPASKYSNSTVESVFLYYIDNIYSLNKDIANKFGVSEDLVKKIAQERSHCWLKEKYPDKYSLLSSIRSRKCSISKCTKEYTILSPDNIVHSFRSIKEFAIEHSLDPSALSRVLNEKAISTKGWKLNKEI